MNLTLPKNLELRKHIEAYPPANLQIKKFRFEVAEYIVALIYRIPARNKEISEHLVGGYVPINVDVSMITISGI